MTGENHTNLYSTGENYTGGAAMHTGQDHTAIHSFKIELPKHIELPYNIYFGIAAEIGIILLLVLFFVKFKNNPLTIFFESMYEKLYLFFEEILGASYAYWIKAYVVTLFFVILFSNLMGVVLDMIYPIFGMDINGVYILEHYIKIPTADIHYNLAMAIFSIMIVVLLQLKHLGLVHFVYDYLPIFGKNILKVEKGNMNPILFYPLWILVKAFDIVLSMFLGFLEIIGVVAKIISLSFRLFGNMASGAMLVAMLITALSYGTTMLVGKQVPLALPIILYLQEILVAMIQAFVFALLVAIFIKVATAGDEA